MKTGRPSSRPLGLMDFGLALLACVVIFALHTGKRRHWPGSCGPLNLPGCSCLVAPGGNLPGGRPDLEVRSWPRGYTDAFAPMSVWGWRSFHGSGHSERRPERHVLIVRAFDRRGVPRGASMAAVVIDLVSYYCAYLLALGIALGILWVRGSLTLLMFLPVPIFAPVAATVPLALLHLKRGRTLPGWLKRLPFVRIVFNGLFEATPAIVHDNRLMARCTGLHVAILVLDAGTLWTMLRALGFRGQSGSSLREFHALDTGADARSSSRRPWGFRGSLRGHAQAHRGAGNRRPRGDTPLFRFYNILVTHGPGADS